MILVDRGKISETINSKGKISVTCWFTNNMIKDIEKEKK